MPFNQEDTTSYRQDVSSKGQALSVEDRSTILARYLPSPEDVGRKPSVQAKHISGRRRRIRPFLKQTLFFIIYWTIQLVFGIYIRLRQISHALLQKYIAIRHYHHRTPAYIQKDLKNLSRIPEHLSVLLRYDASADDGLETLLDEVAELCAWSASAGIPLLSVYEKSGIMKQYMSALQEIVQQKLVLYFGKGDAAPTLAINAPNLPVLSSATSPNLRPQFDDDRRREMPPRPHLNLLLLSQVDGRDTIVDLTRTLTEMSQSHKLRPRDITVDLIDAEIQATTSIAQPTPVSSTSQSNTNGHVSPSRTLSRDSPPAEPDLLIVFAPYIKLDGYPPWQIRLTEIFCVGDSGGDVSGRVRTRVEYQGFLRGLWSYAGAQFRFGR